MDENMLWLAFQTERLGRFRDFNHFKKWYKYRHLYTGCNIAFRLYFKTVINKGNRNEE